MKSFLRKPSLLAFLVVLALGCGEGTPVDSETPASRVPRSENELVTALVTAYQSRDYAVFASLLPGEGDVEFQFLRDDPDPNDGSLGWGQSVELNIHRRMFDPRATIGEASPVPTQLYLHEISINAVAVDEFRERDDLYRPNGPLDSERWRATDAEYHVESFFAMEGETDFAVDSRQNFVILEDRSLVAGSPRKFLLYQWEDLGEFEKATGVEQGSWSSIKILYR